MDIIEKMHAHKWGSSAWCTLFLVAILLLFLYRKKYLSKGYKMFFPFVCMTVILSYNPIFADKMTENILPSYMEYERITWLLFFIPIVAYTLVTIIKNINKNKRNVFFIFIIVILCCIGSLDNSRYFVRPQNIYKISNNAVYISECINNDVDGAEVKVCIQMSDFEYDKGYDSLPGTKLYYGIRQYQSNLELDYVIITPDTYENENFKLSDYIAPYYQYYICENSENLKKQFVNSGMEEIGKTDDYLVFKNTIRKSIFLVRHAQTEGNIEGIIQGGGYNTSLTEIGEIETSLLGEALSKICFDKVYTSELERTQDTANIILSKNSYYSTGDLPDITINAGLNDLYMGDLEGLYPEEAEELYGDVSFGSVHGGVNDSEYVPLYNAESTYSYNQRLERTMKGIIMEDDSKNILVVTHSGITIWIDNKFPGQGYNFMQNSAVTILQFEDGEWRVLLFDDKDYDDVKKQVESLM